MLWIKSAVLTALIMTGLIFLFPSVANGIPVLLSMWAEFTASIGLSTGQAAFLLFFVVIGSLATFFASAFVLNELRIRRIDKEIEKAKKLLTEEGFEVKGERKRKIEWY